MSFITIFSFMYLYTVFSFISAPLPFSPVGPPFPQRASLCNFSGKASTHLLIPDRATTAQRSAVPPHFNFMSQLFIRFTYRAKVKR